MEHVTLSGDVASKPPLNPLASCERVSIFAILNRIANYEITQSSSSKYKDKEVSAQSAGIPDRQSNAIAARQRRRENKLCECLTILRSSLCRF